MNKLFMINKLDFLFLFTQFYSTKQIKNSILYILFFIIFFSATAKTAPEGVHKTGVDILRSGDLKKTIDYHIKQLNTYPDDEVMMLNLAFAYIYLGKTSEAEKTFVKILSINPTNKDARSGLFNLYNSIINKSVANNDFNKAFDFVNKGFYYLPENSIFYSINAELYSNIKNFFKAGENYKKSWEIDYTRTENIINVWKLKKAGEAYYRLGNEYTRQWREFAETILKKNPDNRELLNLTAEAYFFNNENPQKRNRLRNRAMELYRKENQNRPGIELQFPLYGRYQIASGYFEWELDTHNGYDGYCLDLVAIDENGGKVRSGTGLDVALSFGTPIYAAYDGIVASVVSSNADNPIGVQSYFTPNFIKIKHKENGVTYYSRYYHIKKNSALVSSGQQVKKGDQIAEIGNSGYSFAPHLHFGLYDANGISLPLNFETLIIKGRDYKRNTQFKHGQIVEHFQSVPLEVIGELHD